MIRTFQRPLLASPFRFSAAHPHDPGEQIVRKVRIKLHDKLAAADKLLSHLGGYVERREVGPLSAFRDLTDEELNHRIVESGRALGLGDLSPLLLTGPKQLDASAVTAFAHVESHLADPAAGSAAPSGDDLDHGSQRRALRAGSGCYRFCYPTQQNSMVPDGTAAGDNGSRALLYRIKRECRGQGGTAEIELQNRGLGIRVPPLLPAFRAAARPGGGRQSCRCAIIVLYVDMIGAEPDRTTRRGDTPPNCYSRRPSATAASRRSASR
jgi:hypothetical protein